MRLQYIFPELHTTTVKVTSDGWLARFFLMLILCYEKVFALPLWSNLIFVFLQRNRRSNRVARIAGGCKHRVKYGNTFWQLRVIDKGLRHKRVSLNYSPQRHLKLTLWRVFMCDHVTWCLSIHGSSFLLSYRPSISSLKGSNSGTTRTISLINP